MVHTCIVNVGLSKSIDELLAVGRHLGTQLPNGRGLHQAHPLSEREGLGHGSRRVELHEVRRQLGPYQLHVGALVGSGLVVVGG